MSIPLERIRAIEWAQMGNGPIIGVHLGWMGAAGWGQRYHQAQNGKWGPYWMVLPVSVGD